jgi:hypothetical protein
VVPVKEADWPINILPALTPFSAIAPDAYAAPAASISAANVLDPSMAAPPPVDFALALIILRGRQRLL